MHQNNKRPSEYLKFYGISVNTILLRWTDFLSCLVCRRERRKELRPLVRNVCEMLNLCRKHYASTLKSRSSISWIERKARLANFSLNLSNGFLFIQLIVHWWHQRWIPYHKLWGKPRIFSRRHRKVSSSPKPLPYYRNYDKHVQPSCLLPTQCEV